MSRVAAIDCGTNSIRLLVADVTTGSDGVPALRDVHRETRIVRLGQGVDASGELAPEALERTRAALADYTAVLLRKGTERVRMVATSATRDARNRDDFFGMVRDTLGVEAEVISGDEEAQLAFTGAVGDLDPADGPFVVVDVGGGSTELVVGTLETDGASVRSARSVDIGGGSTELVVGTLEVDKAAVRAARSVDIGSVRITERCLPGDPPGPDEVAKARELATSILDDAFAAVPVDGVRTWVGVAGTITTLSAVAQRLPEYDPDAVHLSRIPREDLHRVTEELLGMSREERSSHRAIDPGRIDVIGGGALIVDVLAAELYERAGVTELVVSEHDILDGIARSIA
jgi:exopolyphosphatase / guanosine-5'-triphosphate,3'-diphosphate pyrophosphatase